MVTTDTPSPPDSPAATPPNEDPGFFPLLVRSVFEPGANSAVILAMNVSFFFLILTLFGLAFLTQWNKHTLFLLGVTTLLWGAMAWFVVEITKVQHRPDNMPPMITEGNDEESAKASGAGEAGTAAIEPKKDK
ncbi:hypothetical protein EHS25_007561 [Saitozyma podzolica]|uniref:SMK killer toxin resistance protein n=1 Tax=Saitozyma podzolica TaxID=1890683 RepID=A0A427YQ22_9TREE|nr:hypothetical protein EHS25_007561 [Saitozyma podzolica]